MLSLNSLREIYSGKRVLVTGHTGFKGSWLIRMLYEIGAEVWGFSKDEPEDSRHIYYELNVRKIIQNPNSFEGDVSNYSTFHDKLNEIQPDFVFHLAGQAIVSKSYVSPHQTFLTNTSGVLNLMEYLRSSNTSTTTLIVTSDKCYSNNDSGSAFEENDSLGGKDPYSASKATAELIYGAYVSSFPKISEHGIASARAGNVFGGGDWSKDRLIPDIMRNLTLGNDVELRMPEATRPWTYVLDVTWGYIQLAAHLKTKKIQTGQSWNFASGANLTVLKLTTQIVASFSGTSKILISRTHVGEEVKLLQISPKKIMNAIGWSPRKPVLDQINETSAWYQAQNSRNDMIERSRRMILEYFVP